MKRIASLLLVFSGIVLMNSGCNKENLVGADYSGCCLPEVFNVPNWYTDSIYYSGNNVSLINRSYRYNSNKNTQSRFEYGGSDVKIFVKDIFEGSCRDYIYYDLSFQGSKIMQVETNSGRVRANYFYDADKLNYILYFKNSLISDSIAIQYDVKGINIAKATWFKADQTTNKYRVANTVAYYYDDKNNPHKNSIHFLYNFYDAEEFSLDYFNSNNIKAIKSEIVDLHTDYFYNENNYPTCIIFYDGSDQETDKNLITYDCK
jgi:hypothetical protein